MGLVIRIGLKDRSDVGIPLINNSSWVCLMRQEHMWENGMDKGAIASVKDILGGNTHS
jgi:hypothetical protein